jgi:hypothetical protein
MNQAEFHLKLVINLWCVAALSRHGTPWIPSSGISGSRSGFKSRIEVLLQPKIVHLSNVAVH